MTQSNPTTTASGLDVTVEPTTANATNATLIAHATMDDASASTGLENITIDTGGGLDLGNVTVVDVGTAGIDDAGTLPGNQTDESLAANVERNIELADNGSRLTIPLDGNQSIEPGDEIVAVIDSGIETKRAGNYSFALVVDGAPPETDSYNLTASTPRMRWN